ncbi:MAG: xanthine dehydrogenase family protein subunit M [Oligoflexia bacterium]|nr:xanthine dehydrogenase family protein subunit M [Oligoflexia bacterium]
MRGNIPAYDVRAPKSLTEALEFLHREPGAWKPLAGGTDLMVLLEMGVLEHKRLLSLHAVPELKGIREEKDRFVIGALTTFGEIQAHAELCREFPLLREAAASVGAIAIQNRATLAGNIANASPAADSAPALLALDAKLELASHEGSRWVEYRAFHTGYKKTLLQQGELIRAIALPKLAPGYVHAFRKVGTRKAQAISKVAFAGLARKAPDGKLTEVRLAFGSVAPTAFRATTAESRLQGRVLDLALIRDAKQALQQQLTPIDDVRSTAEYRRRVSLNLLEDFLLQAKNRGEA